MNAENAFINDVFFVRFMYFFSESFATLNCFIKSKISSVQYLFSKILIWNILTNHDFTTFIDDTLAAELTVLRHSLLFWILCCFRYFSRKWHKIPAGEFVR